MEGDKKERDDSTSSFVGSSTNVGVGSFFKVFFKIVFVVVFIGVFYFGGSYLYAQVKDMDIPNPFEGEDFFSTIHPNQFNTYDSLVKENEENPNLGVKISDFKSDSNFFYTDEEIQIGAIVKSSSLSKEDSTAVIKCELEDYYGEIIIDPEEIIIPGNGEVETETVRCSFNSGLPESFGGERLDAKLKINYDFYGVANFDIYIIEEPDPKIEGQNDFDYIHEGFRPENLGSNNMMRSEIFPSPANLAISTNKPQPYYANDEIGFSVSLSEEWDGNLWQLRELKLKVPREIEIKQDTFCDFINFGEIEGNYKVYNLKEEELDKANNACSPEVLDSIHMSEKRCMKENSKLTYSCSFIMPSINLLHTLIVAEADYVYEIEETCRNCIQIVSSQVA